jgi:hypothetical protein
LRVSCAVETQCENHCAGRTFHDVGYTNVFHVVGFRMEQDRKLAFVRRHLDGLSYV